MACDYFLAKSSIAGNDIILRLYGWIKPTISLGYHQESDSIDLVRCRNDGVDVVRRPTGGRAILHWRELTYCIIHPVKQNEGKSTLKKIYKKIHWGLLQGFIRLGINLTPADGNRKPKIRNPLCFASSAGTELEIDGKKVIGSAQRLIGNTVLQHGSILLSSDHLKILDYLLLDNEEREQLRNALRKSSHHLPIDDSPELRSCLAQSIAEAFEHEIAECKLPNDIRKLIMDNCKRFSILNSRLD